MFMLLYVYAFICFFFYMFMLLYVYAFICFFFYMFMLLYVYAFIYISVFIFICGGTESPCAVGHHAYLKCRRPGG